VQILSSNRRPAGEYFRDLAMGLAVGFISGMFGMAAAS